MLESACHTGVYYSLLMSERGRVLQKQEEEHLTQPGMEMASQIMQT